MRRLHIIVLAALVLSAALLAASTVAGRLRQDDTLPEIRCSEEPLTVSVQAGSDSLLEGVTAWDEKDGDLTPELLVQRIQREEDSGRLTVTYAVADSDHHVTARSRTLIYSDYTPPRFTLSRELRYEQGATLLVRDRLGATDLLDGSISDRIKITATSLSTNYEGIYPLTVEVSNSLGDTASLTLDVEIRSRLAGEPIISLRTYLVYLGAGQELSALDYLASVTGGDETAVYVTLPEGGLQPGVNKVRYSCTGYTGVTGSTIFYVIVE